MVPPPTELTLPAIVPMELNGTQQAQMEQIPMVLIRPLKITLMLPMEPSLIQPTTPMELETMEPRQIPPTILMVLEVMEPKTTELIIIVLIIMAPKMEPRMLQMELMQPTEPREMLQIKTKQLIPLITLFHQLLDHQRE